MLSGGFLKALEIIDGFALFLIFCGLSTHQNTHTNHGPSPATATKRATARVPRAMAVVTKKAMAMAARLMATVTKRAIARESNGKGRKRFGNGDSGGG